MKDSRLKILDLRMSHFDFKFRPPLICNLKFAILALWASSLNLCAQISQPSRYEREQKNSDHEFVVISMKEKGIALVREAKKNETRIF